MSTEILLEDVVKKYDDLTIIPDLSLRIKPGEFFTLLGPSGCGKTTLLRMIAGFATIEEGLIKFNNNIINEIPPHKRNIGMVFQNYAIFPHMTVKQNIAYGLKNRRLSKEEIQKKTNAIMDVVRISEHRDKLPEKLSGGQQQRVALARSIVVEPDVLLMDEPLSNLDAKLRIEMRSVIRNLQKSVGITTVYVTHDQEEALAVSDRIAVINFGEIQQVGEPKDIYLRPYNEFVASFIGSSNIIDAELQLENNRHVLKFSEDYSLLIENLISNVEQGPVRVSVRPEEFTFSYDKQGMKGLIVENTFLGKYINYVIEFSDGVKVETIQEIADAEQVFKKGEYAWFKVDPFRINVFNATGDYSLISGVEHHVQ